MQSQIERLNAALAGRYVIERELGAGGMATVYLADDERHARKVALKVLKPELAAVLGGDRFVVEIRTTAALQHPHILPLFDSGTADGFLYYVMPFIDGETLRTRLNRETQLGVEEALRIAADIADALEYAHRHNVIHRDIKPENILLHEGRPMVADFGIALAVSAAAGGRMTETGLSLGTPHYMSPEQATADKDITARSDVYSLGSVLYEMLAGQPPHVGGSAQQVIMKIVTEQAQDVSALRKSVPPHVADAIATSLEKLPADRWPSAKAFADALTADAATRPARAGTGTRVPARAARVSRVRQTVFAVACVATAVLGAWGWLRPTPVVAVSRQRVVLWQHALESYLAPGVERHATQAAIAPDGSSIAFVDSVGGRPRLLLKKRDEVQGTLLVGTEGAMSPFWSPDGAWIGFVTTDGAIRKVPADGGGVVTLATDGNPIYNIAAWLDDGTIAYADVGRRLRRVSADGGESAVIRMGAANSMLSLATLWPLPGSRALLYTACIGNCATSSDVFALDLSTDSTTLLVRDAAGVWFVPPGHLLYTSRDGGLYAVPFDARRLAVTGGAVPVLEGVAPARFTLSASGDALYALSSGDEGDAELVWVSRDGIAEPVDTAWRGRFEYPALSPDGRTIAVSVREVATHLWIRRIDGTRQRMTSEGTVNWRPSWSRDGQSILFSSNTGPRGENEQVALSLRIDAASRAEAVFPHKYGVWEAERSQNGEWIVVRSDEIAGDGNILARRTTGDTSVLRLAATTFIESQIALSPDARWLAYASNASGENEVYVAAFPTMNPVRLVSQGGGTEPRWSRDGRELFFKSGGRLAVVSVSAGSVFLPGQQRALFSLSGYRAARNRQQYDVSPDGRRFLMIREPNSAMERPTIYVENWMQELKARLAR